MYQDGPDTAVRYDGEVLGSLPHGYGIVIYHRSYYEGQLSYDTLHGRGRLYLGSLSTFKDPMSLYNGEFKKGNFHGKGVFYHANGDMDIGTFVEDELHGFGVVNYHDGSRFEGNFEHGERHGQEFS